VLPAAIAEARSRARPVLSSLLIVLSLTPNASAVCDESVRRRVGRSNLVNASAQSHEPAQAARHAHRLANLDPEQPITHRAAIHEAGQRAKPDLEGRLHQVLGVGLVGRHRPSGREEYRPVGAQCCRDVG